VPKLLEQVMIDAAKTRFRGFNLTLPTQVTSGRPPNIAQFLVQNRNTGLAAGGASPRMAIGGAGAGNFRLAGAGAAPARPTANPQNVPPALFRSASNDKVDVDFQTEATNEFSNYISAMCHALVGAHDNWRFTACLKGVSINAIMASGGFISSPSLSINISANGPQQGIWGNATNYTRVIADGLATCWHDWEQSVRVPGLPWYPAFAAFPSPMAPPMPNVPTPLAALTWSSAPLQADNIKATISRKLSQPGPFSDELFQSIGTGFVAALNLWFPVQMVTNVMGRGPVPTFAPPYVPVGPVVGGGIIEAAPHFAL
jgi:hypothetical protein